MFEQPGPGFVIYVILKDNSFTVVKGMECSKLGIEVCQ